MDDLFWIAWTICFGGYIIVPVDIEKTTQAFSTILSDPVNSRDDIMRLAAQYETGEISTSLYINGILRQCNHKTQALDVIKAWDAMLLDVPSEAIQLLQDTGEKYSTFILSNTNELHLDYINKQLLKAYKIKSFDEIVDKAFYSHIMKLRKPDPAIYKTLLHTAELNARETLFLDDRLENIKAARDCGIYGIHIRAIEEAKNLLLTFLSKEKK